jgi:hypothetical protein
MADLLDLVLDAHGGLNRWRKARTIHGKGSVGGLLWSLRGQEDIFSSAEFTLDVQTQSLTYHDFTGTGLLGVFTPDRVAIEDPKGRVHAERSAPRQSFADHGPDTPWDDLHALYFGGYAMWNYFTAPYLLTRPGVQVEELEPWEAADGRWRRLRAVFPDDLATHSREQVFHYDASGLLRRHDYAAEVLGAPPAAHYTDAHTTASGLVFPTRRYVVPLGEDGNSLSAPVLITIDLAEVNVT